MREGVDAIGRILGKKDGRSLDFGGLEWSLWIVGRCGRYLPRDVW